MSAENYWQSVDEADYNLTYFPTYEKMAFVKIGRSAEFKKWFGKESEKSKAQIDARLENIGLFGHFGDHKSLGEGLSELRWKNGRRIYYALKRDDTEVIIILIGGSKNAQKKDIGEARKILARTSI